VHIPLPNGDITRRTLQSLDRRGLPFAYIGGRKYRPRNEALAWINTDLVRRQNRRRNTQGRETMGK